MRHFSCSRVRRARIVDGFDRMRLGPNLRRFRKIGSSSEFCGISLILRSFLRWRNTGRTGCHGVLFSFQKELKVREGLSEVVKARCDRSWKLAADFLLVHNLERIRHFWSKVLDDFESPASTSRRWERGRARQWLAVRGSVLYLRIMRCIFT